MGHDPLPAAAVRTPSAAELPADLPPVNPKPSPYRLNKRDRIAAGCLLALSFLLVITGLWDEFCAGFTVACSLLFCMLSLYFARKGRRVGVYPLLCGILAALLCGVFCATSGTLVRLFAVPVIAALSVIWFASLAGHPIPADELGLASLVLRQAGNAFVQTPRSVRSLFSSDDPHVKTLSKATLGLVCAVPVLCAVIPLLIRSDAAFEGLMQHMFSDFASTAAQCILALLLFPLLVGFAFSMRKDAPRPGDPKPRKRVDTTILAAFLGVLSLCYLVFLFSQLAYFFSAFSGMLPEDYAFTVADYARRGFFEMCWIAGINLCVLYALLLLAKQNDGKIPVLLRVFGTFIGVFTLLILSTAISKMVLYVYAFGMTVLRIGTSAFMAFMAVVFIALLLRFYIAKIRVLPVAAVTAAVVLLVLGLGNAQRFAAQYNYTAYASGKLAAIDVEYLRRLGDEGIPYLIRLTDCPDPKTRQSACGQLAYAIEDYYTGEWQTNPDTQTIAQAEAEAVEQNDCYFEPNGKIYPKLSQQRIPRKAAYDALDAFLKTHPTFLRDHIRERNAAADADDSMLF